MRNKVEEVVGHGGASPSGHIPFTPRAKKVLELSLREALALKHSYIGTEHILLGLVREGEGVAAQVLVNLGADLRSVRQRVIEIVSAHAAGEHPEAVVAPSEPPHCPRCGATLTTAAAYRVVRATADDPDQEPVQVVVVYCRDCGTALGTTS